MYISVYAPHCILTTFTILLHSRSSTSYNIQYIKINIGIHVHVHACVNALSKNWALGTLGQFHPLKVQSVIPRMYENSHFKFFRICIEGIIIWFLWHFYAIQATSHIKVFLRPNFHLMCLHVHSSMHMYDHKYFTHTHVHVRVHDTVACQ